MEVPPGLLPMEQYGQGERGHPAHQDVSVRDQSLESVCLRGRGLTRMTIVKPLLVWDLAPVAPPLPRNCVRFKHVWLN